MRFQGVDPFLEEQADKILHADRKSRGKTESLEDGCLTEGQLMNRRNREVYNKHGVPEPHLFSGIFRRAYNPDFGRRSKRIISEE